MRNGLDAAVAQEPAEGVVGGLPASRAWEDEIGSRSGKAPRLGEDSRPTSRRAAPARREHDVLERELRAVPGAARLRPRNRAGDFGGRQRPVVPPRRGFALRQRLQHRPGP